MSSLTLGSLPSFGIASSDFRRLLEANDPAAVLWAEKERRKAARASLISFTNAIDVPGKPASDDEDEWRFEPIETSVAPHHALLCKSLQGVFERTIPNLMVFMPPGSAKSTYSSVVFPTWAMGKTAGFKIILGSYATGIARKQGRRARSIVRSLKYRQIFGAPISNDNTAADEWSLVNGSEFMAGGLLAGMTGNRANGIIVDDPVAGREEADSPVIRKKTREAYEDDLMTRLIPGGWQIIVQTRWHEDDLAGGILPKGWKGESGLMRCRDGQDWLVLCLPAICDREDDPLGRAIGERLWANWFTGDHFAKFQSNKRTWSALYQQRPVPAEGLMFQRGWFKVVKAAPAQGVRVRAWDLAGSVDGDWTVGVKMLKTFDGRYFIEAVERFRGTPLEVRRQLTNIATQDGRLVRIRIPQDPGQAGVGQKIDLTSLLSGYIVKAERPEGKKATRAEAFSSQAEAGNVFMVEGAWNDEFLDELTSFPLGKHDDQVDAAADAFNDLALKQFAGSGSMHG